jgi:hypothetical protein
MKTIRFIIVLLAMFLAACNNVPKQDGIEPEANGWQFIGRSLTVSSGKQPQTSSLALDAAGYPVVSWNECFKSVYYCDSSFVYVKRWNGSTWIQLGEALNIDLSKNAYSSDLALDTSGNPVVSFTQCIEVNINNYCINSNIYVKRWNGSNWVQLGNSLDVNRGRRTDSSTLALDILGNPVVAWREFIGATFQWDIYVKRWNSSNWVSLSGPLDIDTIGDSYDPDLAIDNSGHPVISWHEEHAFSGPNYIYVKRWNGTSWIQVGEGLALDENLNHDGYSPRMVLDNTGNPVVGYKQFIPNSNSSYNVYVKHWNGTSWIQVGGIAAIVGSRITISLAVDAAENPVVATNAGATRWNGSSWVKLIRSFKSNIRTNSDHTSLKLDSTGNPIVSWSENYELYVAKYATNNWIDIGSVISSENAVNSVIAGQGSIVAWNQDVNTSGANDVYVAYWYKHSWRRLGTALDMDSINGDAKNPSLVWGNNIIVTWQENDNVYAKIWKSPNWTSIGSALDTALENTAITPSLTLDKSNLPVIAYAESGNIVVKRASNLSTSAVWTFPFGTSPLDINAMNQAFKPSLALKSDNNPIVAWHEQSGLG